MNSKKFLYSRRISQVIFLFVLLFFIITNNGVLASLTGKFFFSNPYLFLSTLYISVPFLIIILTTILWGRFFCGWVCPLGTLFDFLSYINPLRIKIKKSIDKKLKFVKYAVLILFTVLILFNIQKIFLFDPIGMLSRFFLFWVVPIIQGKKPYIIPIPFFIVLIISAINKRFWCKYICPLGALMSLLSIKPVFKKKIDKCVSCGKCERSCSMSAIEPDKMKINTSDCIQCGLCFSVCPVNGINFNKPKENKKNIDIERRHFIFYFVFSSVIGILFFKKKNILTKKQNLLRPPGVSNEKNFFYDCVRCGKCIDICPTNALYPSFLEAGLNGLFTPKFVPSKGYCDYNCNKCSLVCPTHAIKKLPLKEKQKFKIGIAQINKTLCLAWNGRPCLLCETVCPTFPNSIKTFFNKSVRVPSVDSKTCIGCGACEYICPSKPVKAIKIQPI